MNNKFAIGALAVLCVGLSGLAIGQTPGQFLGETSGSLDRYSVSGLFLGSRAQGLGVNFATVDSVAGRTAGAAIFRCVSGGCK